MRLRRNGSAASPRESTDVLCAVGELYPLFHALRDIAPVHRTHHRNLRDVWVVSRFDDALELYRNPRAVSDPATAEHFNHGGKGGPFYQMLKQMMLFLESEQHAHVRRIAMKAFTPRAIASVTPITRDIADGLIREVAPAHQMDIVEQFAYRLPLRVIAYILGVPEADFETIERFASDFARGSELAVDETDQSRRADAAAASCAAPPQRIGGFAAGVNRTVLCAVGALTGRKTRDVTSTSISWSPRASCCCRRVTRRRATPSACR